MICFTRIQKRAILDFFSSFNLCFSFLRIFSALSDPDGYNLSDLRSLPFYDISSLTIITTHDPYHLQFL